MFGKRVSRNTKCRRARAHTFIAVAARTLGEKLQLPVRLLEPGPFLRKAACKNPPRYLFSSVELIMSLDVPAGRGSGFAECDVALLLFRPPRGVDEGNRKKCFGRTALVVARNPAKRIIIYNQRLQRAKRHLDLTGLSLSSCLRGCNLYEAVTTHRRTM